MTTYNTGNPIGSTAAKDLYDNAENLDLLMNGPNDDYPDRLGVSRQSWRGMENDFNQFLINSGYEFIGDYDADGPLLISTANQVFTKDGEYWRAAASLALPYTTVNNWVIDQPKFVSVGDAVLRQDLSEPTGTTLIGRDAGTLEQALDAIEAKNVSQDSTISAVRTDVRETPQDPILIDMHFGAMKGNGLASGETGSEVTPVTTTTTANRVLNNDTLQVASVANLQVGQLIAYQADNGQWYSTVIRAINTLTLTVTPNLEFAVSTGAIVSTFYQNFSHPNTNGYLAIADYALRQFNQFGRRETVEFRQTEANTWRAVGAAVLTAEAATSYLTPGSAVVGARAVKVQTTAVGQGAISNKVALAGGAYKARVILNGGTRDAGFSGTVTINVLEITPAGTSTTVGTSGQITSWGVSRPRDVEFTCRAGSAIRVQVLSDNGAAQTFHIGTLSFVRQNAAIVDVNRGKHVFFGDSYFNNGTIFSRIQASLTSATLVNKSVSGNQSIDLINRFDADVAPENPDFVWVMVGTNDFFASVTQELFETRINILKRQIAAIGAQAIFFTPSVGDAFYVPVPGERLTLSRSYAVSTGYLARTAQGGMAGNPERTSSFSVNNLSISAGQTVTVACTAGSTVGEATLRYLAYASTSLEVAVGYGSGPTDTTLDDAITITAGATQKDRSLPRTSFTDALILIRVTNPTGGALTLGLTADIAFTQAYP